MDDLAFCSGFCTFRHTQNLVKYVFMLKSNAVYVLFCHLDHNISQEVHSRKLVCVGVRTSAKYRGNTQCELGAIGC